MGSGLTHSVRYLLKSDAVTVVVAEHMGRTASRSHDTLIAEHQDSISRLYRFNNHHPVEDLDGNGNCTKSALMTARMGKRGFNYPPKGMRVLFPDGKRDFTKQNME